MRIRKAILFGARDLRLVDEELAAPAAREICVDTEVTALSTGTDLGNYKGRSTEVPGAPDYPRSVGYSNVGVIRECGSAVSRWRAGQRVFSTRPHQSAYLIHEDDLIVSVPAEVAPEAASLAYLTQLGIAGLRQVRYEPGERVAVIGLGVIGLCTVAAANALGATAVAIANSPSRRDLALEVGAAEAYLAGEAAPESADIVVLTANTWDAYREAVSIARHGGRVSVLGFPGRAQPAPAFNPLDPEWLYRKQLIIAGSGFAARTDAPPQELRFNLRRNLELIFDYMRRGRLPLERIITHRFPAAGLRDACELALARDKAMAAAVFDWRPPAA